MTSKKILITALLLLLSVGLYREQDTISQWLAIAKTTAPTESQTRSLTAKVITQNVILTSNDIVFEAIGTGRARLSVQIYPAVSGEVASVNFKAQDRVEKNVVLVQLDNEKEKLAVRLAEVNLKGVRNLLSRYEQAVKDGAVPESEVDSARADVDAAQVELEQAIMALNDRQIRAPFAGVVGFPGVDPGDRVTTSTVITGLDDRDILHVDFEISEALAGNLLENNNHAQEVAATTPVYPQREFTGRISAQESRVDPQRRTLLVRASIENEYDTLRPGMSFNIRWHIHGEAYPTVPEIALQWGRNGSFIWIVRDETAERVPARVIARNAGAVLVKGNIFAGDAVVVEGLQRLRQGEPVEHLAEAE
jgi:RND family efflux transporter MFP subunit